MSVYNRTLRVVTSSIEVRNGGVPNRGSLYAVAAAHSKEAIETLYDLMKNSGAAKAILNKTIPDLRVSEGDDYIPPTPPTHTMSSRFTAMVKNMLYEAEQKNKELGLS